MEKAINPKRAKKIVKARAIKNKKPKLAMKFSL